MRRVSIIYLFIMMMMNLNAETLFTPFPSPINLNSSLELSKLLFKNLQFQLSSDTGLQLENPLFPASLTLGGRVYSGISISKYSSIGLFVRESSLLSVLINPVLYKNTVYSIDYLANLNFEVVAGYSIKFNVYRLEPYIGGRVSIFSSVLDYSGIKVYPSMVLGIKYVIDLQ